MIDVVIEQEEYRRKQDENWQDACDAAKCRLNRYLQADRECDQVRLEIAELESVRDDSEDGEYVGVHQLWDDDPDEQENFFNAAAASFAAGVAPGYEGIPFGSGTDLMRVGPPPQRDNEKAAEPAGDDGRYGGGGEGESVAEQSRLAFEQFERSG